MVKQEHYFSAKDFQSPDQSYAPIYAWVWNGELSEDGIDARLSEMNRLGIRAFYIIPEPQTFRPTIMPSHLDPNYLTKSYFDYYRYTLNRAKDYGMKCWLYDEGGWPSGGACGKVLRKHPEYAKRLLRSLIKTYSAGEIYRKPSEDTAAAFMKGTEMIEDGHVFTEETEVRIYESFAYLWESTAVQDYPDLTQKEATQAFLEITHEQYKAHLGEHFGDMLTAVFTDEPHAPNLPFREELCRMYEEQYGESILPYLPILEGNVPLTDENIEVRRRWFDLCSKVFCENYLMECKKWSNANQMKFTGHLGGEDDPHGCMYGSFFHVMRGLRCMDIPGVDTIWRQIFPGEKKDLYIGTRPAGKQSENRFFPRYASSAAVQTGNSLAMSESFAVYGFGISFEQMRYVLGFQAIRGINAINIMLISYAREGYNMSQEAPNFSENQACHRDLPVFNRYIERLSYVFSLGQRLCDTALYYPVNDIWGKLHANEVVDTYEALGRSMEARGIDFDIVDDDVILQSADLPKGVISMGNAKYRRIAIPQNAYLSPKVKECLAAFEAGGGILVTVADQLVPEISIRGGNNKIRVMHRSTNGNDLICLFNESDEKNTFATDVKGRHGYYADITMGVIKPLDVSVDGYAAVTLESGESCAVYLTDEILPTHTSFKAETASVFNGAFTFRRTESFVIGNLYPEHSEIEEAPVPAELGEWSNRTGKAFSGSGIYETHFKNIGKNAVLDLGDVRHTCEVFLNGQSLGIRVMKPYRYEISADMMTEENLLQIRVSNTVGNQHQYTKSFDKYKSWQLSGYKGIQDIFDRDTLDSGLLGPVTFWTDK